VDFVSKFRATAFKLNAAGFVKLGLSQSPDTHKMKLNFEAEAPIKLSLAWEATVRSF